MATVTIVQHLRPGRDYGPGMEPLSVRDAWDDYLRRTGPEAGQRRPGVPAPAAAASPAEPRSESER